MSAFRLRRDSEPVAEEAGASSALLRWVARNPIVALCAVYLVCAIAAAAVGSQLAPFDPNTSHPAAVYLPPSWQHIMGTDRYGRDVFSRVIAGARFSLEVSLVAVSAAAAIGSVVGMTSGYIGGRVDSLMVAVVDVLLCFPIILMALLLIAFFGQTTVNVMIAIGIALMPRFARIARAGAVSVAETTYVEAAVALGISKVRICLRHVLPNILSPLLVAFSLNIAVAVLMEASLSYLGVGAPSNIISWGQMVNAGRTALSNAPWISLFGGGAVMATVLSFNVLGDWLRDWFDPNFREDA